MHQIVKRGHLMGYLIRKIFMENACKKTALKTSSITLVNFGKVPKTANACKNLLKIFKKDHRKDILKEIMKKLTSYLPLHPVPIYGQEHEYQKRGWN